MEEWIASQKETTHHKIAITLFPIILFLGYIHPGLFGFGLFLFFIITSFKLLKKMLFFMLILGVIATILPFLAPIIFIIMLVLFFMRIQFVLKNWRPFLAGLIVYGIAAILLVRMSVDPTSGLIYDPSPSKLIESIIVSALGFIGIRATLIWLYGHNYSSYAALGIMGSVPLIIISFILPFLKMHVGGDVYVAEPGVVDGHAVTGETVVHSSDAHVTKGASIQHVQPHVRTVPDGDITNNLSYHGPDAKPVNPETVAVKGYVRTAPDGDVTNNLSYHGPDAKPVNPETVAVKGYVRTAPDGDVTNNLSYHGPGAKSVNVEVQGNDYTKTSFDGDTAEAKAKGTSQWGSMTPEQKETALNAFNGVAVGQGMIDKLLKRVEPEKGQNHFCRYCGKERSGKERFCVSCGGSLEHDEQSPKQESGRKEKDFALLSIMGVIGVVVVLLTVKILFFSGGDKVATSVETSENTDVATTQVSTAVLSDIDGFWRDKDVYSYVGINVTGDKKGEITFYNDEKNVTYLFKEQDSEEKKISLRIYEVKSDLETFTPFNVRVNIVDDQQIELIRLGQEEENLSLTRMTKEEFMNYHEPVDQKKTYTGQNDKREQFNRTNTKIPFSQIEGDWINTSGGDDIAFILGEGEKSGELIIAKEQPGGGRLPQHKFYISSEPKSGDNTYILTVENSDEYRTIELTLTEDRLRMKVNGRESVYRRG
ncbi:hypothetical protein [Bacillus mobilis]|uniref:hypothetical protein n=1 Tax=Bacillus mobilis TaxID=2026190 RepID=UPI000A300E3E|nr:hypothetical protein [Bacillus mobilis]MCU5593138.1 energy-coupling factor transporter transmembrane protein EcfT [Bacillus mobilis]MCU5736300.1 energy-coupling factor transporter transmembrane protein EcfT [Bacillus mobilis]MCU9558269.1 energy-coupling factor transporter transmembrane protein EcfT [Bacillus mobilis]SMD99092.1 hypothetical protein BACERE00177_01886 [Bacillus mobilis]HDR7515168.1 hypothetical protein [Bacillus mobilis]